MAKKKTFIRLCNWFADILLANGEERGPCVPTESQIFSRPARPHSVNKHFIVWPFFFFFCSNKIVSHCFCGPYALLVGPYAFFRPYHLDAYGPHTRTFSEGFPRKLSAGPYDKLDFVRGQYLFREPNEQFSETSSTKTLICWKSYICR